MNSRLRQPAFIGKSKGKGQKAKVRAGLCLRFAAFLTERWLARHARKKVAVTLV
jgi:hypothetical protein